MRYARGRRVLDPACGSGYGAADLAQIATTVIATDLSSDAIRHAQASYPLPNLEFLAADAQALPFRDRSFDLITAFEVIEHLDEPRNLLAEARRLLSPGGLLLVSTPNKLYYAESRGDAGANPFHKHEFEFAEFQECLRDAFSEVTILLQNVTETQTFYPHKQFWDPDAHIAGTFGEPESAQFFLAICSQSSQPQHRSLVYVPHAGNLLRTREQHIFRLEDELSQVKHWLAEMTAERDQLLQLFAEQKAELEEHNRWAEGLNHELAGTRQRIATLQDELAAQQAAARTAIDGYAAKVTELEAENQRTIEASSRTEQLLQAELAAKTDELARCVDALHAAEATVEERTHWAQTLQGQINGLERRLTDARNSKWVRLGRHVGVGPDLSS